MAFFDGLALETVAAVPGMVAGMLRHLTSLRKMTHDGGWIHHLLHEAENERMHLMIWMVRHVLRLIAFRKPLNLHSWNEYL